VTFYMTLVQLTPSKIMFGVEYLKSEPVQSYLTIWMLVKSLCPNTRFCTQNAFLGLFLLSVGEIL